MPVPLQALVDGLADRTGLPVVLEDLNQQLIAYSAHYEVSDPIRDATILRRTTTQQVVDLFDRYDLARRTEPFVVAAEPDVGMLARLCIPIRYLDVQLGYAWVLLPDGEADAATIESAARAQEQLSLAMLAETRVRARESDSLLSLISADPETRIPGLMDVEARGGFEPPRRLVAVVCTGPAWADSGVRGTFWTAAWAPDPQHRLRGVSDREGAVLLSVRGADPSAETGPVMDRALQHVRQSGQPEGLVLGVGGVVDAPDLAHLSHRQAQLAARVALRDTGAGPVAWWDGLGVYRFLSQLPLQTLAEAVDPRIMRVLDQAPELLATAERHLQHGGAITAVAAALHIHRTTLYYRLDRLRDHGLDTTVDVDRGALITGLAALRLLGRWPIRSSSDEPV